jgi:hypothetical protein
MEQSDVDKAGPTFRQEAGPGFSLIRQRISRKDLHRRF